VTRFALIFDRNKFHRPVNVTRLTDNSFVALMFSGWAGSAYSANGDGHTHKGQLSSPVCTGINVKHLTV